ncbi:uncharacterized protein LOC121377829 [Gigantopelta aegis]|uniref:uncharacterized protein LOC121377829 n=1 Tax=Gigantopelta aegis TaxID=1735272 RepID=UPI001B88CCF8|nr:uncharacterized protein LOC121377829 [Gigantopelta aegis]
MKAYKSLEAYKYVVSGHVQVVLSNPVDDKCPFIALKSKVTPSQRARDKPHEPWVFLEKNSGTVYCAHCTCMAGLGEVCSHVGALLFKIEMGVKMGMTQTSSTSKACQWNSTFRKECKTAPSMVIVRLSIDVDFCQSLIAKCEHFVNNFVKNELVSRKLENQPVVTSTHKEDNSDQTWCICAEVEYGRMIKCDNEDCPYQWFHYKCVNIRRKPRGKWFCASCDK